VGGLAVLLPWQSKAKLMRERRIALMVEDNLKR